MSWDSRFRSHMLWFSSSSGFHSIETSHRVLLFSSVNIGIVDLFVSHGNAHRRSPFEQFVGLKLRGRWVGAGCSKKAPDQRDSSQG